MGFFKDFKDDFSQAVNELMPGEDNLEDGAANEDLVVNTLENEVDVESELSKLDGLLDAGDFTDCKTADFSAESASSVRTAAKASR